MAITDTGVPATDPHTMLTTFISTYMDSPDGIWSPTVNSGWLEYKKQNTFQIALTPLYASSFPAQLTGGAGTADPRISSAFYVINLYATTRILGWTLYRNMIKLLNDGSRTSPQNASGLTGVNSTDYHWIRVVRAEEVKMIDIIDPECGPNKIKDTKSAGGYRMDITVEIRWNE